MSDPAAGSFGAITAALGAGLPHLVLQFAAALVLLTGGVAVYTLVTPYRERQLAREGNVAAATVLGGMTLALAIPLAALLATTAALLDLIVWGVVALILQLLTFLVVSVLLGPLRAMIEADRIAAAIPLVAAQLAVALLNAAVMVPI